MLWKTENLQMSLSVDINSQSSNQAKKQFRIENKRIFIYIIQLMIIGRKILRNNKMTPVKRLWWEFKHKIKILW